MVIQKPLLKEVNDQVYWVRLDGACFDSVFAWVCTSGRIVFLGFNSFVWAESPSGERVFCFLTGQSTLLSLDASYSRPPSMRSAGWGSRCSISEDAPSSHPVGLPISSFVFPDSWPKSLATSIHARRPPVWFENVLRVPWNIMELIMSTSVRILRGTSLPGTFWDANWP